MNELPLKDIHLPDSNLWWPPAPGWWISAVLLMLLIFAFAKILRWIRYKPVRSLSLKELHQIKQNYRQQSNQRQTLQQLTSLLRRTVMSRSGRTGNAGLVGEAWLQQLNQMSNGACFSPQQGELLMHGRYRPLVEADIDGLLQSCENWIKSLPRSDNRAAT